MQGTVFRTRIGTIFAALITEVVLVMASAAQVQPSNTEPPDYQQMQKRMDQLEQEVRELKEAMSATRSAAPVPAPASKQIARKEDSARTNTPASEVASNQLPATKAAPQEDAPVSVVLSTPTPAPKPEAKKEGTTFDIYGFAMLDSGYDFDTNDPNWYDVIRPTKLPAFNGEFAPNGKVWFGVRQTRFGVKSSTATSFGELKTRFEFELFGTGVDAGQTTFRLRHAYGELGPVLAGQTWSVFMDPDVFPNTIEYWGPNGMVFFRNIQLRWMPINGASHVWIALERPGASADEGVYSDRIELQNVRPHFDLPDLTWQGHLARKWGYLQLAGIFRRIAWKDTNPTSLFKLSGNAFGWGVNASSNVKMGKKDVWKLQAVYGDAIENYMNDAPVDIGIQNNFSNPIRPIKGVGLPVLGIVAFLDHSWSQRFTSSAGYSLVNIQNADAQTRAAFHQGGYSVANLLYHPTPAVMIGGEFQFGRRINFADGFNVNDYRIQFSFKYDWNKSFTF
jgi:hypothetical protein